MRDFDISRRSSDTVAVFTPCPIHCQGYRRPIFPAGLATDTTPGLATDAQARRNISHYRLHCQYRRIPLIPVIPANWGGPRLHGNDGRRRRRRRTHNRHPHDGATAAMGSRLHGNDGRTHIVIPATARGPADGSPSPRERRRWAAAGAPHNRHSRDSGRAAMGSRLHGNDGRTAARRTGQSSFPRGRDGGDGSPSARQRRTHPGGGGNLTAPISSFPRSRGIHGGGPGRVGPRLDGDVDGHPQSSSPRRRDGGDGFPSPRERLPLPGGGVNPRRPYRHSRDGARASMGPRLHGNDGRSREASGIQGTHIVIPA